MMSSIPWEQFYCVEWGLVEWLVAAAGEETVGTRMGRDQFEE